MTVAEYAESWMRSRARSLKVATAVQYAHSLDEFIVTWFNIGSDQTLPVLIWGLMRRGVDPSINALASVLLVSLILLVVVSELVGRRRNQ